MSEPRMGAGARGARLQGGIAIGLITTFCLSAFWRLTTMRGLPIADDIFASDLMNENFPYRFALGRALKAGELPLWVREIYGGFPLLARAEAGVCYPINIALFGIFSPYVALNLSILLTIVIAGVGMYFYVREIGGTFGAALMGGIAFSLSGYLMAHLKHLSMTNAACWLPAGLFCLERAVGRDTRRALLWFGVVFALQHLAGNAQTAYYCGWLYLIYFGFRFMHRRRQRPAGKLDSARAGWGRRALRMLSQPLAWSFVGALILGSAVAAIQLIPTYEMVGLSGRSGGVSFEYASSYAYDVHNVWTFFYPYINGDVGNATYSGPSIFWEDYGYVGILTVLLALSAVVVAWRNWHVRFFGGAAVVSYVLVLGPATPVYRVVFDHVPGMNYFRFPTRLLLVTDASLIVLACVGLTCLATRVKEAKMPFVAASAVLTRVRRWQLMGALPVLITGADLSTFQLRQNPIADFSQWTERPRTARILDQDASLFRLLCLGGNHAHRRMFQAAGGWEGDLRPFVEQREFLQPSSNVLYGISSPNGYANLTPTYVVSVWGDQNQAGIITRTASTADGIFNPTATFWKLMRMYNVKYITSFWPFVEQPGLKALGEFGGAYLYRNDDILPRAYVVGDVLPVADDATALVALGSPDFDPARSVLLPAVPPHFQPGAGGSGTVDISRYTANNAELMVRAAHDAILVFSDTYYPGWHAKVDGAESPIYRANITQRAVVVPAGEHKVTFQFRPASVMLGLWISVAALIVFIACFLFPASSRRRRLSKFDPRRDMVSA